MISHDIPIKNHYILDFSNPMTTAWASWRHDVPATAGLRELNATSKPRPEDQARCFFMNVWWMNSSWISFDIW